jgi:predicted methyltransferase
MYSSTLCQLDEKIGVAEAARVLKDDGVLLINDMVRNADDGGALEHAVAARVLTKADLVATVEAAGFTITEIIEPRSSDAHFRKMLDAGGIGHLIDGISPIIIRATKGRVAA